MSAFVAVRSVCALRLLSQAAASHWKSLAKMELLLSPAGLSMIPRSSSDSHSAQLLDGNCLYRKRRKASSYSGICRESFCVHGNESVRRLRGEACCCCVSAALLSKEHCRWMWWEREQSCKKQCLRVCEGWWLNRSRSSSKDRLLTSRSGLCSQSWRGSTVPLAVVPLWRNPTWFVSIHF